jgi:hypothetical protein
MRMRLIDCGHHNWLHGSEHQVRVKFATLAQTLVNICTFLLNRAAKPITASGRRDASNVFKHTARWRSVPYEMCVMPRGAASRHIRAVAARCNGSARAIYYTELSQSRRCAGLPDRPGD